MLISVLGVLLKVIWVQGVGCTIVKSNTTILAATFIYSMSFDLIVLCLTAYKLAWTRRVSGTSGIHSKLVRMVFSDGLVYFILAYVFFRILAELLALMYGQFLGKSVGYDIHDHRPKCRHGRHIQCSCSHGLDSTFSYHRRYMHQISSLLP